MYFQEAIGIVKPPMNESELERLQDMLGFRIKEFPDLFDFETSVTKKRARTASLRSVIEYRGTTSCMIAYPGNWTNSRQEKRSCSGRAEVVDHLVPISSNRIGKELGVRAKAGKKVPTQDIGSAHISNLIVACAACNSRKLQSFDREVIHKVLGLT